MDFSHLNYIGLLYVFGGKGWEGQRTPPPADLDPVCEGRSDTIGYITGDPNSPGAPGEAEWEAEGLRGGSSFTSCIMFARRRRAYRL